MNPTLTIKIAVFVVLGLLLAAIFADLTLRSGTDSGKEKRDAKEQISEVTEEVSVAEERKVQSQVEINWKKKHRRYTYGGQEE